MKRAPWVRELISAGNAYHYLKKVPWQHNLLNLSMTGVVLGGIGLVFWAGLHMHPLVYLPLAALALGHLYFALFILVIHECSHNMYVLSSDRSRAHRLNRWIGVVAAIPLFTNYIEHWEKGHRIHHLHPGAPQDLQVGATFTGPALWRELRLLALVPGYGARHNPSGLYASSRPIVAVALSGWLLLSAAFVWSGAWAVPLAALWAFNVLQALNLLKKSLEHGAELLDEPDAAFRTRSYFPALGALISPFNINYHFEHHLNFTVPWYDLPKYHAAVAARVPASLHGHVFNMDTLGHLNGDRPQYDAALRAEIAGTSPSLDERAVS